jgi:tetratricopeptide (TPR) repeat protein
MLAPLPRLICLVREVAEPYIYRLPNIPKSGWFAGLALFATILLALPTASLCATSTSTASNIAEAKPLIEQGIEAYDRGDYPSAISSLKQAQELAPDQSPTALYLGLAYLKQGDLSQAITAWQKYIALQPATQTEKTNDLRQTVNRDLTILLLEQNRRQAQNQIANESKLGPADPAVVAITYYRNLGSPELKPLQKGLTALVIADVSKVPGLKVVERDQLQALLDEMRLGASGIADPRTAAHAGHLLGAGRVVAGSYLDPTKDEMRVDSILVQTGSAATTNTQNASGQVVHFYDVEKRLSAAILNDLGYSEADLKARGLWQAVQTPQTTNYNAFVAFSRGLDAKDRQDYPQARSLFQQAYTLDPSFVLALQELNRTPVAAVPVASVANSVGSQAPNVAAVMAALPAGVIAASVPSLPAIGVLTAPPPPPPPPPLVPIPLRE